MNNSSSLLVWTSKGLYCPVGDFFIDPMKKVDRAVITHAHSDHARSGSKGYLTARDGYNVLRARLTKKSYVECINYGETINLNGVKLSLHPAGHILGSSQVRLEYRGEVWAISGDYKLEPDPTCLPLEPIRCHTFLSECTFGLPIYHWPSSDKIIRQINRWWQQNRDNGMTSFLHVYSLGKAQRILASIDPSIAPIYVHKAVSKINDAYAATGVYLPPVQVLNEKIQQDLTGALVLGPVASPSAYCDKYVTASASGWLRAKSNRKGSGLDRCFILSDHADWNALLSVIKETTADRVIAMNGFVNSITRWLRDQGISSGGINTIAGVTSGMKAFSTVDGDSDSDSIVSFGLQDWQLDGTERNIAVDHHAAEQTSEKTFPTTRSKSINAAVGLDTKKEGSRLHPSSMLLRHELALGGPELAGLEGDNFISAPPQHDHSASENGYQGVPPLSLIALPQAERHEAPACLANSTPCHDNYHIAASCAATELNETDTSIMVESLEKLAQLNPILQFNEVAYLSPQQHQLPAKHQSPSQHRSKFGNWINLHNASAEVQRENSSCDHLSFADTCLQLDVSMHGKAAAIADHLRKANKRNTALALRLLRGIEPRMAIRASTMRELAVSSANMSDWMYRMCHDESGDLIETISLIVPPANNPSPHLSLEEILAMTDELHQMNEDERPAAVLRLWQKLDLEDRMVLNRIIAGGFRVQEEAVIQALSLVTGIDARCVAYQLQSGGADMDAEKLIEGAEKLTGLMPGNCHQMHFIDSSMLPNQLELVNYGAEISWDGIRSQIIKRNGACLLWSIEGQLLTDYFPELIEAANCLPDDTVLEGTVLAWKQADVLPVSALKRRMKSTLNKKIKEEVPVIFMAHDLVEERGESLSSQPYTARRSRLDYLLSNVQGKTETEVTQLQLFSPCKLQLSPLLRPSHTFSLSGSDEFAQKLQLAEQLNADGVLLKLLSSAYGHNHASWLFVRPQPILVNSVLVSVRVPRAENEDTEFTFALRRDSEFVPIAKISSLELNEKENDRIVDFIKNNTLEKFGPVRVLHPKLVFQLACGGIEHSSRHKAGLTVRRSRVVKWCGDMDQYPVDSVEALTDKTLRGLP